MKLKEFKKIIDFLVNTDGDTDGDYDSDIVIREGEKEFTIQNIELGTFLVINILPVELKSSEKEVEQQHITFDEYVKNVLLKMYMKDFENRN